MADLKSMVYLFYGYGGEYVFSPLAEYMRQKGYDVCEMDLAQHENPTEELMALRNRNVVFVNSWHLFFDSGNWGTLMGLDSEAFSPLEVMDMLKPVRSIFYPHDLDCFQHPSELKYLDLFDTILLPFRDNSYYWLKSHNYHVETVGWIKKTGSHTLIDRNARDIVFFPQLKALKNDKMELDRRVSLKLFAWENMADIEEKLVQNGYSLVDKRSSVFDAMTHSKLLVACESSSVIIEAAYSGFPIAVLMDEDKWNSEELPDFEWVYPVTFAELNQLVDDVLEGRKILKTGEDVLESFQYEKAEKLITLQ